MKSIGHWFDSGSRDCHNFGFCFDGWEQLGEEYAAVDLLDFYRGSERELKWWAGWLFYVWAAGHLVVRNFVALLDFWVLTPQWLKYARTHISACNFSERVIDFPYYAFVGTSHLSAFQNFQNLLNRSKSGRMAFVSVICDSKQRPKTSANDAHCSQALCHGRLMDRPVTLTLCESIELASHVNHVVHCAWG